MVSFSVSITKHKDPAKLLLSSSSLMKASFLSSNATLCLSRSLLFFFCFNELFLFLFFVLWPNFDSLSRIRLLLCFLSFNFLSPSSSLVPWLELLHLYEIWKSYKIIIQYGLKNAGKFSCVYMQHLNVFKGFNVGVLGEQVITDEVSLISLSVAPWFSGMWAVKDSLPTLSVSQVITGGSFVDLEVLPSEGSLFGSEVFAGGMIAFSS